MLKIYKPVVPLRVYTTYATSLKIDCDRLIPSALRRLGSLSETQSYGLYILTTRSASSVHSSGQPSNASQDLVGSAGKMYIVQNPAQEVAQQSAARLAEFLLDPLSSQVR